MNFYKKLFQKTKQAKQGVKFIQKNFPVGAKYYGRKVAGFFLTPLEKDLEFKRKMYSPRTPKQIEIAKKTIIIEKQLKEKYK